MNKSNSDRDKMIRDLLLANKGLNQHIDICNNRIIDLQNLNYRLNEQINVLIAEIRKLQAENHKLQKEVNVADKTRKQAYYDLLNEHNKLKAENQAYYDLYKQHEKLKIEYSQLSNHSLILSRNLEAIRFAYLYWIIGEAKNILNNLNV